MARGFLPITASVTICGSAGRCSSGWVKLLSGGEPTVEASRSCRRSALVFKARSGIRGGWLLGGTGQAAISTTSLPVLSAFDEYGVVEASLFLGMTLTLRLALTSVVSELR